ncbi:MAG: hypothetical protein NTY00_10760 [Deltaproteobacteria bacterium]|nr:hypothetical protein [Deltaproteobacteria bacterium]
MITPYQQGNLDGLCGAYATINAARLISKKLSIEEWQVVLLKILRQQIKQRRSVHFAIHGLGLSKVSKILQRIISPELDIIYSRPFRRRVKVPLPELWDSIDDFLNAENRRSVIIGIETKDYGHWTVVESISDKRLNLFDSGGRKFINRNNLTTTEIIPQKPILISGTSTFFLERKFSQK